MTRSRIVVAVIGLVGALLGAVTSSAVAEEPPCGERCSGLTVQLRQPARGVEETMRLVSASDPERVVGPISFDPEGRARTLVAAGRYKLLLGDSTWWGGRSHATATVLDLAADRQRSITVDRTYGGSIRLSLGDRVGDVPPFVRVIVRDRADPVQVLASTTTSVERVALTVPSVRTVLVDLVDLTGTYRSRRIDPLTMESDRVYLSPATGPEPVYDPDAGPEGEILGIVSGDDWEEQQVTARLYRADVLTSPLAYADVDAPRGPDAANLRFADVRPGRYKVQLTDGVWLGGGSHATADIVTVRPGQSTRVLATVPARGEVVGSVVSDRGVVLSEVLVRVYRPGDAEPVSAQLVGPTIDLPGTGFVLEGLPPSDYQIRISDTGGRIVDRWWGGGAARSSAATVRAVAGRRTDLGRIVVGTGLRATTSPVVTGTAARGRTLAASPNRWSLTGVKVARQWLRDGRVIRGATGSRYRLVKADRGHRISVRVTGRSSGRPDAVVVSRSTARVR
jgi:hypothetical protein